MSEAILEQLSPPLPDERRASVRYQFCAATQPPASIGSHWEAQIGDISDTGVGLVCQRPFDLGRLLTVELHVAGAAVLLHVCVVRSVQLPGGDWQIGAAFTEPLLPAQMRRLLG